MTTFTLQQKEISILKAAHKASKKKREADRIKTIILLGTGWTIRQVVEALLLDDETIRNYLKRYKSGGLEVLLNDSQKGYGGKLSKLEMEQLDNHLNHNTYASTKEIVCYVTSQNLKPFRNEYIRTWLGRRPHACMETYCTEIGRPCIWPYETVIRYALKILREQSNDE